MSDSDLDLLARYSRQDAEEAFAELVRRHLGLVYSAALRQVRSPELAEEVSQSVFTDLARNSARLKPDTVVSAWLYQVTRRTAIDVVRREASRQLREQIATEMNDMNAAADWTHIEPLLDEAMHALDDTDRAAVLLRYFENKSLREVGDALGASENAAQKRLTRAIERLRAFFAKRGITVGASGLVVVISSNAIQATPVGLAITISSAAALAETTVLTTGTAAATKAIAMTTLQKTLITATIGVLAGTGIYEARQASRWRNQMQSLQQQQIPLAEQVAVLKSENEKLSHQIAMATQSSALSGDRLRELLKLRGEVGLLRRHQRERQQALAAQSKASGIREQTAAAVPPTAPAPFQVQLVTEEAGEDSEPIVSNLNGDGESLYVQKTPLLDYTAIKAAAVTRNASGAPEIDVEFNDVGSELFAAVTAANLNKRLAIVLDGQLYSAPVIRSPIAGGKTRITGNFSEDEAKDLASKINEAILAR
jgi:RNA polymerase sigma factor (sigma-70 family)